MNKQVCSRCYILKEITEFSLRKDTGTYRTWCKPCHRAYTAGYKKQRFGVEGEAVAKKAGGREHLSAFLDDFLSTGVGVL